MRKQVNIDMDKVKALAFKKRMVWTDLAKKADITTATIYAVQSGRRSPSQRTLFKLAAALDVDPSEIIKQ